MDSDLKRIKNVKIKTKIKLLIHEKKNLNAKPPMFYSARYGEKPRSF